MKLLLNQYSKMFIWNNYNIEALSIKGRTDDKEKDEPFVWTKLPVLSEAEPALYSSKQ